MMVGEPKPETGSSDCFWEENTRNGAQDLFTVVKTQEASQVSTDI